MNATTIELSIVNSARHVFAPIQAGPSKFWCVDVREGRQARLAGWNS